MNRIPPNPIRFNRIAVSAAVIAALTVLIASLAGPLNLPWADTAARTVQRSWAAAHRADAYRFTSDIVMTITPAASPGTVGQQSTQQFASLEGSANLPEGRMFMTLRRMQSTGFDQLSDRQFKVEDGKSYQRLSDQEAWEESSDFSGVFAPGGDLLAFLSAARDIRRASAADPCPALLPGGASLPGGVCYRFEVDGPAFAAYMSAQFQQRLAAQGKLPPGVQLAPAEDYQQMSGQGALWLGADGLPAALVMDLEFPPTVENIGAVESTAGARQESVSARVTSSFLDYQFKDSNLAGLAWGLGRRLPGPDGASLLGLWLGMLLLLGLVLVRAGHSRRVYAALIVTLIAAMVVGPLLQQVKAASFYSQAARQQQAGQQRDAAQEQQRRSQEQLNQPRIAPDQSPLEQAQQKRQAWLAGQQAEAQLYNAGDPGFEQARLSLEEISAEQQAISQYLLQLGDTQKDSDGDTLSDSQETLLGSNPNNKDTDRDGLQDNIEVAGFKLSGSEKVWYGDPRSADSNLDGLPDGLEWNKDTDRDGVPDLWSLDNDSDKVPDRFDLSPNSPNPVEFSFNAPLTLKVDNARPDRITYLDIQVRPQIDQQLQYTSVVLKWPAKDVKGQMLDIDGLTFRDKYTNTNDPRDAFGNVKLVPALQIEIQNPRLVPPKPVYDLYGAVVKDLAQGKPARVMTVPLAPQEENSGRRVSFQARVPLLSSSSWGEPLIIKPIWIVTALVDTCKEAKWVDGQCTEFDKLNEHSAIQTYPMDAKLTGLNLRENIGVDFAVVYTDAGKFNRSNAAAINKLDTLAVLADGLDKSFVGGRRDSSNRRDFTLDTISQRFDNTINANIPISPTRFAIADNIFRVKMLKGYSHPDGASAALAVTETVRLLRTYQDLWTPTQPVTPTLLFAQEDRYRVINLDSLPGSANVGWQGRQLNLNLPTSSYYDNGKIYEAVPEALSTYLNWGSYFYTPSDTNQPWKAVALQRFLNYLPQLYPLNQLDPDPEVARGMQIFLDLFYRNLYAGVGGVIEMGGVQITIYTETDNQIARTLKSLDGIKLPLKLFMTGLIILIFKLAEFKALIAALGAFQAASQSMRSVAMDTLSPRLYMLWMEAGWKVKTAGIAMLVAGLVLLVLKLFFDNQGWAKIAGMAIGLVLGLVFVVIQILTFAKYISNAIHLGWRYAMTYAPGGVRGAAWLMLAVAIAMVVYLLYQLLSGDLQWGSVQFVTAVVYLIVTIMMMVAMIVIEMIPIVGPILVLILTILAVLAQALHLPIDPVAEFTNIVVGVFYIANAIGSPDAKVEASRLSLANPNLGMQVGNTLKVEMAVKSINKGVDPQSWQLWRFSEEWDWNRNGKDNLRQTAFKINLSPARKDVPASHLGEQRDTWSNFIQDHEWRRSGFKYNVHAYIYRGERKDNPSTALEITKPGVNSPVNLYFNYSYAAPTWRCALSFICKLVDISGKDASPISNIYFDIFPHSVDQFVAWGWLTGDPADLQPGEGDDPPTVIGAPYPYPMDADGDGLMSTRYNGNDPDDTRWDTDGDTLSDYFEVTSGQWGGGALDPTKADSEGDGLSDDLEVRWGANPRQADSDGDGLSDLQEITGYDFYYNPANQKKVHITSSPASRDTDRDGILDNVEVRLHALNPALYPYNAAVWNLNPMDVSVRTSNPPYPDGYVPAGWNGPLNLTRSVNDAGAVIFEGDLVTRMPRYPNHGISDYHFKMAPGEVFTQSFAVNGFSQFRGSERIEINTSACSTLLNPLLIYPFNRSNYLYNDLGPNYTPQLIDYQYAEQYTVFPMEEPAPGTLGYSLGLAASDSIGRHENGLGTILDGSYSGPFTWAGWVNPKTMGGYSNYQLNDIQTVFALQTERGRAAWLSLQRVANRAQPWDIRLELGSPAKAILVRPWGGGSGGDVSGWVHLAVVYDGKTAILYINGLPSGSAAVTLERTGGTLYTGKDYPYTTWKNWVGLVDEIYFYTIAANDYLIYRLAHPGAETDQAGDCKGDLEVMRKTPLWIDADNPSAAIKSLEAGQYVNPRGALVIGGSAADPTSPVSKVEFQVDFSSWEPASGQESWAYSWNTAGWGEGKHTLGVRATDTVNHTSSSDYKSVIIDRQPPKADVTSVPTNADRQDNTWYLRLWGTVYDPKAGLENGSGPASVEVRLIASGIPDGGYQLADLDPTTGTWTINYRVPGYDRSHDSSLTPDPSAEYEVKLRATDRAGNVADPANARTVRFAIQRPQARFDLGGESPMSQVISNTVTFSGLVTDTSKIRKGIDKAQIAFIPQKNMYVLNQSTLLLHLDDPSGSNFFADASGKNNSAACWPPNCPKAREEGIFDSSVLFDGNQQRLTIYPPLSEGAQGLSVSFWVWVPTYVGHDNRFLAGQLKAPGDRTPGSWWVSMIDSRHIGLYVVNQSGGVDSVQVDGEMTGRWLHVIVRLGNDGSGHNATLTVNLNGGALDGNPYSYASGVPVHLGGLPGGDHNVKNWIDEVTAFPYVISSEQIAALYEWQNIKWQDVTLDRRGALVSPWSLRLPTPLADNFYVVAARAQVRDAQDYGYLHYQPLWSGIIDLNPPAVDVLKGMESRTCIASDLSLDPTSYTCGDSNASSAKQTFFYQVAEWYRKLTDDQTRLFKLETVKGHYSSSLKVTACDRYGHCSSITKAPEPGIAADTILTSGIVSPTLVTDLSQPVTVSTYAYARDGLQGLNVTLNGAAFDSTTWPANPPLTETLWQTAWSPVNEGAYNFSASASDYAGQIQTATYTTTVYVDLYAPTIAIDPQPVTLTRLTEDGAILLRGVAADSAGQLYADAELSSSDWAIDPGPLPVALTTTNGTDYTWELRWPLTAATAPENSAAAASFADGETFTVTARAFDAAWREVSLTQAVVVDVVPPQPVTLTVAYQGTGGAWAPLAPGDTVRAPFQPQLRLEWSAATDGSGLRGYFAGFLPAGAALDPASFSGAGPLAFYGPADGRLHEQASQEAQAYYAYVAAEDIYGNRRWNVAGPFFIDAPSAPDYFSLAPMSASLPAGLPARQMGAQDLSWPEPDGLYRGWITPEATLLGTSRAADERLSDFTTRSLPQSLAMSWDAGGLRLNWSGADWETDGDLLIYLDTLAGAGTGSSFNPYPQSLPVTVTLPAGFDLVLWAPEAQQAFLLGWDGAQWQTLRALDSVSFHYTQSIGGSLTDFYLPFDWIGVADPQHSPLRLLAMAVDQPDLDRPQMEIWAALPALNPLTLPALGGPAALPEGGVVQMTQVFEWDTLAAGTLPVAGGYGDVDLRLQFSGDPLGAQTQQNQGGYTWAWQAAPSANAAPLLNGQFVTYQAVITNAGSLAAENLWLELRSYGALILTGGTPSGGSPPAFTQSIQVGSLQPGEGRSFQWTGLVDNSSADLAYQACLNQHGGDPAACAGQNQLRSTASLEGNVYLDDLRLVDHFTSWHQVDAEPPSGVDVLLPPGQEGNLPAAEPALAGLLRSKDPAMQAAAARPPVYVRPGQATVWVSASDPGGISSINLEAIDPGFNVFTANCPVERPLDGTQQCSLSIPPVAFLMVRATATDHAGHTSGGASTTSPWRLFVVDQDAPLVAVQPELERLLENSYIGLSLPVSGTLSDSHQAANVVICLTPPEALQTIAVFLPLVAGGSAPAGVYPAARPAQTAIQPPAGEPECLESRAEPGNTHLGSWSFNLHLPAGLENHAQTLTITGYDAAGNPRRASARRCTWTPWRQR